MAKLGVEIPTIHAQVVRVTTTVSRGRPPEPVGVLVVQVTITPAVVAWEYIRKRIPTGTGGMGGEAGGMHSGFRLLDYLDLEKENAYSWRLPAYGIFFFQVSSQKPLSCQDPLYILGSQE